MTGSTTINIALLISIISCVSSLMFGLANFRSTKNKELKENISETSTIITKLAAIENDVREIKDSLSRVDSAIKKNESDIKILQKEVEYLKSKVTTISQRRSDNQ